MASALQPFAGSPGARDCLRARTGADAFLAADGSIFAADNRISLCQATKDIDVLHAFYAYVGCPDRPVTMLRLSEEAAARQLSRGPAAEARIHSARIVHALARHGVVSRKTASATKQAPRRQLGWASLTAMVLLASTGRAESREFGSTARKTSCSSVKRSGRGNWAFPGLAPGHGPMPSTFGASASPTPRLEPLRGCSWDRVQLRCSGSASF